MMAGAPTRWSRTKRWPGWAVLGIVVVGLLVIGAVRDAGPRTSEDRVDEISKQLACPICAGESIFESRNDTSAKIRNLIRSEVASGLRSDDEIIASIEEAYPDTRFVPKATGIDSLVWILPVVAFVCAVAGLAVAFRRWRRASDSTPTDEDRLLVEGALLSGLGDNDAAAVAGDER
jgi:cytochrome c-type biogenesis protein CcmH